MKIIYLALLSVAILGLANASAQTVRQQEGQAAERSSYAQQDMTQIEAIRLQLELADRAAKEADQIRHATLAAQAAREARGADLEKEIERCLQAGLPCPTEATWQPPTSGEIARAKFADSMREQMNARVHQEYSNPAISR